MTADTTTLEREVRVDQDPLIDLIVATAKGDRKAFKRLYDGTSGRMFATALRIARQRDLAEEILQDAYLTVWRKAEQYSPDRGTPLAWMTTIVRHRAIDALRRQAKAPGDCANQDASQDPELVPDPRAQLQHHNGFRDIRACIESLPANHQKALLYAFYYGMTHEEMSRHFDAPLGTVKSWVRRGLGQLKVALTDYAPADAPGAIRQPSK